MLNRIIILIVSIFLLSGCGEVTKPLDFQDTPMVNKQSYLDNMDKNGVVLMDICWGRWWGCGTFENAQLISLNFDKMPMSSFDNETPPTLVINSPSRLNPDQKFINYAYSLEPGEYALSGVSIKVAESVSKVGFYTASRKILFQDGKPTGGTFTVKPNEVVYIGNFYLDCQNGPTLWRYYADGKAGFDMQLKEYQKSFPFLDLNNVSFRLFKTDKFGSDYELPE